ncbi:MAG: 23S rRNA (adenine(2503)-C(2))-methyltransferase RlmN [Bacillota bacterium]
MPSVFDLDQGQLEDLLAKAGEKPYRTKQILGWIYQKFASSWDEMSDLPARLRQYLVETVKVSQLELLRMQEGQEEWAKRFLWGQEGKPLCESVLLSYKYGLTGCVSTQVGCPVGCAFCASALLGFERNLSKGEILEEFIGMCRSKGERLGHLVFMGTGEPFLNYDNVMAAIDTLCDPAYYGLSRRKVTVSTVGIPSVMRRYVGDCRGARLALSLHAPDDETRNQIIPMNHRYPVASVVGELREFATLTGQRVTIEYMLLKGLNDSVAAAEKLGKLVNGIDCLVNLIPWNEVPGFRWRAPDPARVKEFQTTLERNRVKVTVRRRLGVNIEAACGQLRRKMS